MDVSRKRLFSAFSPNPITDRQRLIFNIAFMIVSFAFEILAPYIKLSDIMNFAGAIFCFFFVYLIPVALHFRCLAKTPNN
jgi:Mn2+/Fe2+ NRAMP family transporter